MVRIRTIALVALLLPSLACAAQIPGLTSKPAAKSTPSANVPADPLGRGTPHGTVLGFLHAAQDENYSVAAQYFQPATGHHRLDPTEEQDLAAQLLAVINQKILTSSLESLSDDPQGRLDDGLPPNQELLTGVRESNGVFSIELLRLDDDHGNKLWYISRKTLDTIPETYDSLQFSDIEKKLPPYLTKHRFLSMPLWQWIAILVALPLAVVAGWILSLLPRMAVRYYRKKLDPAAVPAQTLFHIGPGTLLLAALVHYVFVFYIGASIVYRQYYRRVIWIFLAVAFYWLVIRVTREVSARLASRLTSSGRMAERSIVSLARRVLEVTVFIVVALIVLSGLGVNVTAALAGLGIGGLAIGLGAQKTFENLLGGISILIDPAVSAISAALSRTSACARRNFVPRTAPSLPSPTVLSPLPFWKIIVSAIRFFFASWSAFVTIFLPTICVTFSTRFAPCSNKIIASKTPLRAFAFSAWRNIRLNSRSTPTSWCATMPNSWLCRRNLFFRLWTRLKKPAQPLPFHLLGLSSRKTPGSIRKRSKQPKPTLRNPALQTRPTIHRSPDPYECFCPSFRASSEPAGRRRGISLRSIRALNYSCDANVLHAAIDPLSNPC